MHGNDEKRAKEVDVDPTEYKLATKKQWTGGRDRTHARSDNLGTGPESSQPLDNTTTVSSMMKLIFLKGKNTSSTWPQYSRRN